MTYKPYRLLEFQHRFATEESCLQAIFEARWPRGFVCSKCGHNDGFRLSKRRSVQCCVCRRQTSITAGTVFHKTRIPLRCWFWLIFLMTQDKGGISTMRAAALLDMHYTTVWNLMHKLRIAMEDRLSGAMLAGFVEIDDAFFGGKARKKRGRAASNKKLVSVMIERLNQRAGDVVCVVLPNLRREAYQKAVLKHIEPMTEVQTDFLPANSVLHGLAGTLHMSNFSKTGDHGPLENVDRVISLIKRFLLGTYHQYCARKHLQRFLNEFCYRFNRRYSSGDMSSRLLSACALHAPVPYAAIS